MFEALVIGAGFSGAVVAERLARVLGKRVLVIEQRRHIAGNCFDYRNREGISVHQYGPHLFHTDNRQVWRYLADFTQWLPYEHRVLARVDGVNLPLPFNLTALQQVFPAAMADDLERRLLDRYPFGSKVPILELRKAEDPQLKQLADFIYEKVFINYTTKQWGVPPEAIAPEVTARVPVMLSRDDRYFQDTYQAIPQQGYTQLVQNILDHPLISVLLHSKAEDWLQLDETSGQMYFYGQPFSGPVFYTGMLDQLFGYRLGALPYRSLQFQFETLDQAEFQPVTTVNYPNNYDFTRITEFKHITGQSCARTTIVREYPQDYDRDDPTRNVPYYPIFNQESQEAYQAYARLAATFPQLQVLGRLAEYRYYDMDDAIARALAVFEDYRARQAA